ncbi:MAG: hypothetical protein Q4G33_04530 [bacterium]|nr:hypothetical protein [bacterium]
MEIRDKAYKDYQKGMKYKDIAEKYGVSLSAVKSWASRYWKAATKEGKAATSNKKKSQQKGRGAPKGNKNAVGNSGGAPIHNKNALKHGGYTAVYYDTLDDEELAMINDMPHDEEEQLVMQIELYSVRERRLLKAIKKYSTAKGDVIIDSITTTEEKKKFRSDEDKAKYEELRQAKIDEEKISYLYDRSTQATVVENNYKVILALETELSRIQRNKTSCIEALLRLRKSKNDSDARLLSVSDAETVNIYIPDNGRD